MKPACFVHVFKAGGTSVSDWLLQYYSRWAAPPDPMAFHAAPQDYDAPLIRGHIHAADAIRLEGRVILTMVREPRAHLMSALWHLASGAGRGRFHAKLADPSVLIDKARELNRTLAAMQSSFFAPRDNLQNAAAVLERFDAVGLTEHIDDTLRLFAWRLELPAPKRLPHQRNSGAGAFEMPDEIRSLLERHLYFDGLLYEAAKARFRSDLDALSREAGSTSKDDIDAYLRDRARSVGNNRSSLMLRSRKYNVLVAYWLQRCYLGARSIRFFQANGASRRHPNGTADR